MTHQELQQSPSTLLAIDPTEISAIETCEERTPPAAMPDGWRVEYVVLVHMVGGQTIRMTEPTAAERDESALVLAKASPNLMHVGADDDQYTDQ